MTSINIKEESGTGYEEDSTEFLSKNPQQWQHIELNSTSTRKEETTIHEFNLSKSEIFFENVDSFQDQSEGVNHETNDKIEPQQSNEADKNLSVENTTYQTYMAFTSSQKCDSESKVGISLLSLGATTGETKQKRSTEEVVCFSCTECLFQTKYQGCLKRHMLRHKRPDEVVMLSCTQCRFQSKYKECLTKHSRIHQNSDKVVMYNCDQCSYCTKHKWSLIEHFQSHKRTEKAEETPQKSNSWEPFLFKCSHCNFKSNYNRNLKEHMFTHEHVETEGVNQKYYGIFRYDQCSFQTDRKCYLTSHSCKHISIFSCSQCLFETKYKCHIKEHRIATHYNPGEVTIFTCDQCSYSTKFKSFFVRHSVSYKKKHEISRVINTPMANAIYEIATFKCDQCFFRTKRKADLSTHVLSHGS